MAIHSSILEESHGQRSLVGQEPGFTGTKLNTKWLKQGKLLAHSLGSPGWMVQGLRLHH